MKQIIMHLKQNNCLSFLWTFICCMILTIDAIASVSISYENVSIQCSENPFKAFFHEYSGEPNTQLTLITDGLQLLGENMWSIKDSFVGNIEVKVIAECLTYESGRRVYDTTNIYNNMWPPGKTLVCEKGDGMAITMFSPNDKDPNKYIYKATMIKTKDDEPTDRMQYQAKITLKKLLVPAAFS